MKPTNDERREVAAKLREPFDVLLQGGYYHASHTLFGMGLYTSSEVALRLGVCRLADLIEPEPINGATSDGYHTFNELYDHRAKLFSVVVAAFSNNAWKSKRHSDGSMYEGMFIVGIDTPHGQATYHYEIEPYWELFHCSELPKAPEWDGHTPTQAIDRIAGLAELIEPEERTCHMRDAGWDDGQCTWGCICSECGAKHEHERSGWMNFCPNCGARVIQE